MNGLVLHAPNWLGDSILCRPAVAGLLAAHDGRAVVVAHPRVSGLWRAWPDLDVVETRPGSWLADVLATSSQLRTLGTWEQGVLFSASFRSAATLALGGVKRRVGFAGGGRSFLLTDPIPRVPSGRMHYSREFFHLLPAHATPCEAPPFAWPEAAAHRAEAELSAHGLSPREYLAIAPGSAGAAKRYPPAAWREVVQRVASHMPVVLVGTAAEGEWAEAVRTGQEARVANLCGATDLAGLAIVLANARAFAGADSGASHLAAAVSCPCVVLFGPGDPVETSPLGEKVEILRDGLWCSPCRSRKCLRPEALSECMDRILPEQVASALLRMANSRPSP